MMPRKGKRKAEESKDIDVLNHDERRFVTMINRISIWLARHKLRSDVLQLIIDEFGMQKAQAELWIAKTEEFMSSGLYDDIDKSKELYLNRLNDIFALCMAHSVKDAVEVTTRPTKVTDDHGNLRVINGTHTKVKPNTLDTGALQVAVRVAKEIAHITGARPKDGRSFIAPIQINVGGEGGSAPIYEAAMLTDQMSNAALAGILGAEIIGDADVVEVQNDAPRPEVLQDEVEASRAGAVDSGGDESGDREDPEEASGEDDVE